jgi:hypothetical protein
VGTPRNIRFDQLLEEKIIIASKEDSRTFSDEVRTLVKLGLQRRRKLPAAQDGRS